MRWLPFVLALGPLCSVTCWSRPALADAFAERRIEAERLVAHVDDTTPSGRLRYLEAAAIYESLHRDSCMPAPTPPADARTCAEVLYNAAPSHQAGGDADQALALYRILGAQYGPLARTAIYRIAALSGQLQRHAEAADAYERFATRYPGEAEAPQALLDALELRLALHQEADAARDVTMLVRDHGGRRSPAAVAVLRFATYLENQGEWERARSALASTMGLVDQGPLDTRIEAHALLGRALAHGPTPASASAEYARARELWKDPSSGEAAIRSSHPEDTPPDQDHRLSVVLNAVGEALVALAEERRIAEVERIKLAPFTGPATVPAVKAYVTATAVPWLRAKMQAIQAVEPAFVAILDVKPVPPPRWVIAAAGTVGMMWGAFSEDLRRVPMPDAWKRDRLLASAYGDAMSGMRIQIRDRNARPAIKKCLDLSVKYELQDERSRRCTAWLVANDEAEYHAVEELTPVMRNAIVRPQDPPLRFDGDPAYE